MGTDSRSRLNAALFGIRDGSAWVAADVFVTRRNGDLLVEGWVGQRVAAILVRKDASGMRDLWDKLSAVAIDDVPARTTRPAAAP